MYINISMRLKNGPRPVELPKPDNGSSWGTDRFVARFGRGMAYGMLISLGLWGGIAMLFTHI